MNKEVLNALFYIYEVVAQIFDEVSESSQIGDPETYRIIEENLGISFDYLIEQEKLLTIKNLEDTERNK